MAKKKVVGKNKYWGIILLSLKTYHKATVNNIVLYLNIKKGNNGTERNRVTNIYIYTQLIFDKDVKTIKWRKNLFNTCCFNKWMSTSKNKFLSTTHTIYKN